MTTRLGIAAALAAVTAVALPVPATAHEAHPWDGSDDIHSEHAYEDAGWESDGEDVGWQEDPAGWYEPGGWDDGVGWHGPDVWSVPPGDEGAAWPDEAPAAPDEEPVTSDERAPRDASVARPYSVAGGGEVLPVLPLGAGLACLGLGIGAFALRLRRG